MKNLFLILLISMSVVAFQGCNNEDVTKEVNKEGSVETELSVIHLNNTQDILTTTHKIWVAGKNNRIIVHKDTIPSLGITKTEGENEAGETKTVPVKKDYEFYVTVK